MEGTVNTLRIYLITLKRIKDYLIGATELVSVILSVANVLSLFRLMMRLK